MGNQATRLREEARLRREDLASRAGVSLSTVGNLERGRSVHVRNAKAVAKVLSNVLGREVSLDELLADATEVAS